MRRARWSPLHRGSGFPSPQSQLLRSGSPRRHFFILGLPRSRTAWLSVLLSQGDAFCYHEATLAGGFDGMKHEMHGHRAAAVGNADSGLLFHAERLLTEFPDAKIAFIHREPDQCLASEEAAFPDNAAAWRSRWPALLAAQDRALRILESAAVHHVEYPSLTNFSACAALVRHCTGAPLAEAWFSQLSRLRIEQTAAARRTTAAATVLRSAPAVPLATGLRVRLVTLTDLETLSAWSRAHGSCALPEAVLPPLGVLVEDVSGPAAALWCYESFGAGVAWLEFAVTRPGLSGKHARAVIAAAIQACTALAGKSCEPAGDFTHFRVSVRPVMVRFLERLGFRAWGEMKQPMLLEL